MVTDNGRKFTHKSQFLDNTEHIIAYPAPQQSVLVSKDGTEKLCGREWTLRKCLRNVELGIWIEITTQPATISPTEV